MFKTAAFIALTLALTPLSASARQWVQVGELGYPQIFVDIDSIKGQGEARKFWHRTVLEEDNYTQGMGFRSVLSLIYIDCARNQYGNLHTVLYSAKGNVVREEDVSYLDIPSTMKSPLPDSIAEITLNYVCSLRKKVVVASSPVTATFPRQTCGDPFQPNGSLYPVFIDRGDVHIVRANLCKDAIATRRTITGVPSVQIASFTSMNKAQAFAQQVGGTVGEPTQYVNGKPVK